MCPIQKGLRPLFSASPNRAPFQLNSRKAGSKGSSQERPFLGPQLIKPRCVWALPLRQPWNLSLPSLAAVRVQCSCQALGELGPGEERGIGLLPAEKRVAALFDTPHVQCHCERPQASAAFRITPQNAAWLSCLLAEIQIPLLLASLLPCGFPGFPSLSPPPHPLLSLICFSADFSQYALQFSPVLLIPSPSFHPPNLFLSSPCLLAFLSVSFGSVSFDTGPRPAAKFQTH